MITLKELKEQIKTKNFAACYLFYGNEGYLRRQYAQALTAALLPEGAEMMNHDIFAEKNATANAIMDAADTLPFLNEKRLITVRDSGLFRKEGRKEEAAKLSKYLQNVPPDSCILFLEEKAEKNLALYKAIEKYGSVVEFTPPTEKELITWLQKESRKSGVAMSPAEAVSFVRYVGGDMENMAKELQKLLLYCAQGSVSKADIEAICIPTLEARVFDLVRAVAEKKTERALQLYHQLLAAEESPRAILSLLARQFRFILQTNRFEEMGLSKQEQLQRLEIKDFQRKEYLKQGRYFNEVQLEKALCDCLQADLDVKNGRLGEEIAVELLLIHYSK